MSNAKNAQSLSLHRNLLREKDDGSGLCDEQHALKLENDGRETHEAHTCIVQKNAIHCESSRGPIYRARWGGAFSHAVVRTKLASRVIYRVRWRVLACGGPCTFVELCGTLLNGFI